MNPLKVAYKNKQRPQADQIRELANVLAEDLKANDKARARRNYEKYLKNKHRS